MMKLAKGVEVETLGKYLFLVKDEDSFMVEGVARMIVANLISGKNEQKIILDILEKYNDVTYERVKADYDELIGMLFTERIFEKS